MAYAAVESVMQTIRLIESSSFNEKLLTALNSLQQVLKRLDGSRRSTERLDALDGQIREAVHKFEDLLEFGMLKLFQSQFESDDEDIRMHVIKRPCEEEEYSSLKTADELWEERIMKELWEEKIMKELSVDEIMEELLEESYNIVERLEKMEEEYIEELESPALPPEEDAAAAAAAAGGGGGGGASSGIKMVGLSDEFTDIRDYLLKSKRPDDFIVFSIVGMAGSNRTILAKILFDDIYKSQEEDLDCGAWVTMGPKYELKEVLVRILAQIRVDGEAGNVDDELLSISQGDDEEKNNIIGEYLHTSLKGRRYMIVLDDVRDTRMWEELRRWFPEQNNGSLVVLTTGLKEVAQFANSFCIFTMPSIDEETTWNILRQAMFCYTEVMASTSNWLPFEEAGKKIARNCHGAITLAKVLLFLLKAEKTPEYWSKVAADSENPVFVVSDEISETRKIEEEVQQYNSFENDDETSYTFGLVSGLLDFRDTNKYIKFSMFPKRFFPKMEIISFYGMAGIGKTTLVKKIFEDPSIMRRFDHRVWVTLGPNYQVEEILRDTLSQICPNIDKRQIREDENLAKDLCVKLSDKRCLIVLDDVWDKEALHYMKRILKNIKGEVLVTTRLAKVAKSRECDVDYQIRLLNKEESWCLLRQKVFDKGYCPPQLEKAGLKIAEICEGLPLLIITVAKLLSNEEKTPEYWNKIVEKPNSIFMEAQDQISEVLSPSYEHLPQHLKACFLYIGVFPQNFDISYSKLINLWIAEKFLELDSSQTIEDFATKCLSDLVDRSLVMICHEGSNSRIKTCRLHFVFWYLSNREAMKNKCFHALNSYEDSLVEGMKSSRRLCIRNSILLGIKDVRNSMASFLFACSLLCTGPPHQYQLPIYLGLRLLRVLDALTIHFYKFPIEVVKLIHLRYLALTCNGELPASISQLQILQFLIIHPHMSIKSSEDWLYLPMEIWDMQQLKHLQITGSNLPNPIHMIAGVSNTLCSFLRNLTTLLDVTACSCTNDVLKRIPKLKKLGIQIELKPHDDEPYHFLDFSSLNKLESLKCVIVNPELKYDFVASPPYVTMFPSCLKKLTLSGLGYPWKYMHAIGKLENLEVLKLRCYAFQGPKWETCINSFEKVKFLLIEDTDLICWKLGMVSFGNLERLSIKHCYKLKELPDICHVQKVEVVDCNPATVTWAKKNREYLNSLIISETQFSSETLEPQVHSSWDAKSLKQ